MLVESDEKIMDQVADILMLVMTRESVHGLSFKELFDTLEKRTLLQALSVFSGHQAKTASFLHLLPTTLCAKMKKHKIVIEFKKTARMDVPGHREGKPAPGFPDGHAERRRDPDREDTREFYL